MVEKILLLFMMLILQKETVHSQVIFDFENAKVNEDGNIAQTVSGITLTVSMNYNDELYVDSSENANQPNNKQTVLKSKFYPSETPRDKPVKVYFQFSTDVMVLSVFEANAYSDEKTKYHYEAIPYSPSGMEDYPRNESKESKDFVSSYLQKINLSFIEKGTRGFTIEGRNHTMIVFDNLLVIPYPEEINFDKNVDNERDHSTSVLVSLENDQKIKMYPNPVTSNFFFLNHEELFLEGKDIKALHFVTIHPK